MIGINKLRKILILSVFPLFLSGMAQEVEEGFVSLFNGKDLEGWEGHPDYWSVQDEAITGKTTDENPIPHNSFLIWRGGEVADFELRFQYRIVNGNSGMQYRSKESPDWIVGGYQADFESGTTYSGILYEERGRGILAKRGEKTVIGEDGKPEVVGSVGDSDTIQAAIKSEDWNDYVIRAEGYRFIHKINGHTTIDVTDKDTSHRVSKGVLALQVHRGPAMTIQVRNIRIKHLKPFEEARNDLKTMEVAEGLEATVFAAEPMVVNPTNMDIDARGRIWVTEGVNYRSSFKPWGYLKPDGDRIVILEDTDGDGQADLEKVFYQGTDINAALGICVLGNKVIVSCSPNILVLTDTDGDDVADKKEVLFTGIGGVDHDHGVHAFVFGPDGKLYFNMGNNGSSEDGGNKGLKRPGSDEFVVDLAGNPVNGKGNPYRQGLVFRCDLDGSNVETLGWNFRNNYEVALDSYGTLWQSDNDDDGNKAVRINFVMEFGNYGYTDEITGAGWREKRMNMETTIPEQHWHLNDPGVVPNLLITGAGSPTGIVVYEGSLLPEKFQGQVIHVDAGPRVVRSYPVTKSGAGYEAEIVHLMTSSDSWFRPSDVCVGPDGALYVADWNDPGVGGHNMQDNRAGADKDPDKMKGRIYRLAPPDFKVSVPELDLQSATGCVKALQSPNVATRYLAWTRLHAMKTDAEPALLDLYKNGESRMRARALHLLARIPGREKTYVDWGFMDRDPDIRVTALRIARQLDMDVIPLIRHLANDRKAPRELLREALIALRHNERSEAAVLWAQLAKRHDGKDRWYLEALGIAADRQADRFFKAWLAEVGDGWNTPEGRDIIWRTRSSLTPEYIVKIIKSNSVPKNEVDRYWRALDFISGPEKEAALLELAGLSLP